MWSGRPAFGGNLYAQILCGETRPQMGTYRPGAFQKPERNDGTTSRRIHQREIHTPESRDPHKVIGFIKACRDNDMRLDEADVIVSGGPGMKNAEELWNLKGTGRVVSGTVEGSQSSRRPNLDAPE